MAYKVYIRLINQKPETGKVLTFNVSNPEEARTSAMYLMRKRFNLNISRDYTITKVIEVEQ